VWNVLTRSVIRRLHPYSEPFDLDINSMTPITSPASFKSRSEVQSRVSAKSSKANTIEKFEVSPFGTYMLSVVNGS
jgi:hypothetical protein